MVIGSPIGRLVEEGVRAAGMGARVALAAAAAGRSVQFVGRTGDDPTADAIVLDLARGGVGHVALLRDPARATPLVALEAYDETVVDEDDGVADPTGPAQEVVAAGRNGPAATASEPPAVDGPASQPAPGPALEPAPEPALEPAPGPALEPAPGPALEPAPGPALEPAPGPALEPAPGPALEPAPGPALEPAPGPALEPADVDLGLRYLTEFAVVVLAEPVEPAVVSVVADAARWGEAMMVLIIPAGAAPPDGLPADVVVFQAPEDDPDGVFADLVGGFAAALDEGTEPAAAFRASLGAVGWTGIAEG